VAELADANALAQIDLSDEAIEKEYPPEKDDGPDEIEQEIRSAARKASQYSDELGVRPGPVFFARNDPAAADAPTAKFHALCVTKREGDFVYLFDARAENLPTLQLIADKLKQLSPPEIEGDPLADFDGELDVEWKDEDDDELEEEEEEKGEEEGAEKKKKRALKLPDMKDLFSGNNSTLHQWMHPLTDAPVDFEAACQWADEESRGYAKVVINCELDHAAIAAKLDSKPDDPQVIDTGILSSIQNFLKSTSPVHQPSFAPVKPDARYHVEYHNYLDTGYRVHLIEARAENLHVVKRLLYVMKYFRTDPDYKCGWMSTPEKPLTEAEARQEMVAHGLGEVTTFDFLHGTFDEIAVKKRLARMTKDEDDPEDEAVPFNLIEKRLWFKAD
jgi:hypothetical protein